MRIAILTHAEAADPAVFANLAKHLFDGNEAAVLAPLPLPRPAVPLPLPRPGAAPAGVVLDAAGLPWDARIHARTKVFVADGTWRQRRNTPSSVVHKVEAELRRTMGLPVRAVPQPPATVPPVPQPTAANSVFGAAAIVAGLPQPSLL